MNKLKVKTCKHHFVSLSALMALAFSSQIQCAYVQSKTAASIVVVFYLKISDLPLFCCGEDIRLLD